MTPGQMVKEFNTKFEVRRDARRDNLILRERLIEEEFKEVMQASAAYDVALGFDNQAEVSWARRELAKELADLVYVVYGYADVIGIDLDAVLAEVHRSNMSKLGEDGKPIRREDGKVLKGPNYSPANLEGIVA